MASRRVRRASPRCARAAGAAQAASTLSTIASAAFAGRAFIALHMTWGAINEWTTQAGYSRLAETAGHPTLRELLRRIMKQEGGHIDFYASEATRRLGDSPKAQKMTRFAPHTGGDRSARASCPSTKSGSSSTTSSTGRRARNSWSGSTAASTAYPGSATCTSSRAVARVSPRKRLQRAPFDLSCDAQMRTATGGRVRTGASGAGRARGGRGGRAM